MQPKFAMIIIGLALSLAGLDAKEPPKPPSEPILCRGHYHSEADAIKQLARMAATYSNLDEWKAENPGVIEGLVGHLQAC